MNFAKKCRELRMKKAATQEQMAAALNLSSQAISKWETGLTLPDITLLPALFNKKAGEYRKKAEYYAKEALERFPENHNNHANLNEAQQGFIGDWNLDNQAERILYYKEFLERHPDSGEALRWYIEELIHVGRLGEAEDAIEHLERLSKKQREGSEDVDGCRIVLYRTKLLWESGKQEEALDRMEDLTKKRPQDWLVWNSAGDMYARACLYREAVACYEKCMEVQEVPRYTDAAMAIAQIGEITGDTALSAKAWNTYVRILQEDWGVTEGIQVEQAEKKIQELGI